LCYQYELEFIEKLPEYAEKFAKGVKSAVTSFSAWIKDNPWLVKALGVVAGGALVLKGAKGLMSMFGLKRDGSSKSSALYVTLAGGASSVMDMFKSKSTPSASGKPKFDAKTGRYRDPSTGKFTKAPSGGAGGGGVFGKIGNFFGGIGSKIADSSVGKFVGKTVSGAKNLASKAVDFANPMTYIKKYMPKIMDSKGFKKAVGSLPKIGKIASAAMIAYDLMSHGADAAAATRNGPHAPQPLAGPWSDRRAACLRHRR
jgi:hypothetical protein